MTPRYDYEQPAELPLPIPVEAIRAAKNDPDVLGMANRGAGLFLALPHVLRAAAPTLWRAWTAGKAVVDLPEPGNGDDCWHVGESDIHGYQENGEPGVCHNLATLDTYPPAEARALAAALLAAADRAEQLADEHNAALQDAEEVSP